MPTLNNVPTSTAATTDNVLANRGGAPGGALGTDYLLSVSSILAQSPIANIPSGTLLGNNTGVTGPPTALFTLPASSGNQLLVQVTGGTYRSLSARAADVANIADYGAPLDTIYSRTTVSATAGSNVVTIPNVPTTMADGVARVVISGIGPSAAVSCVITAGGTGYAASDTIVLAGGTSTTPVTLKVLTVSAGVITNACVTVPGSYTTIPSNPTAQLSTSGAGTGGSFTISWIGLPLQTTISSIVGSAVTLNTPAITTITGLDQWFAVGHDNAPGIVAAIASGAACIYFPSNTKVGIFSSITMPTAHSYVLQGNGTTLVALSPMTQMILQDGGGFWDQGGSMVEHLTIDGMGLAQYNINESGANHTWFNCQLLNATVSNILLSGSESINNIFSHLFIYNLARGPGLQVAPYPNSLIQLSNTTDTDNHFVEILGAGAQNGVLEGGTFGTFYSNVHLYGITAGPTFTLNGAAHASNLYADTPAPGQAGLYLTGSYNVITDFFTNGSSAYGVQIGTGATNNIVRGLCESMPAANVYPGIGVLDGRNSVSLGGAVWPWTPTGNIAPNVTGAGSGAVASGANTTAFQVVCGTGASNTLKCNLPTAYIGWSGTAVNITTPAITMHQTGPLSTIAASFLCSSAPNNGDTVIFSLQAY